MISKTRPYALFIVINITTQQAQIADCKSCRLSGIKPYPDFSERVTHMLTMVKQRALAKVAREVGLVLTTQEIEMIARTEEESLTESGRICFGEGASTHLMHAFASSPYLDADIARVLSELVEAFYEIREDAPAQISDCEIIEALHNNFEGETSGDARLTLSLVRESISAAVAQSPYEIADDEGHLYRWDPGEWHADVQVDGWYGEKWDEDYE